MLKLDRKTFFDRMRQRLGHLKQEQVPHIERFLDFAEADSRMSPDVRILAYAMATAWHETAKTMAPITEYGDRNYIAALYDSLMAPTEGQRLRARTMGNIAPGDGWRYRGRGYVQLTWKCNYEFAGRQLNADLVFDPDLALEPAVAYQILTRGLVEGWFTACKLGDFINGDATDYYRARACVNAHDQADIIAEYAIGFERALGAAAFATATNQPQPQERSDWMA